MTPGAEPDAREPTPRIGAAAERTRTTFDRISPSTSRGSCCGNRPSTRTKAIWQAKPSRLRARRRCAISRQSFSRKLPSRMRRGHNRLGFTYRARPVLVAGPGRGNRRRVRRRRAARRRARSRLARGVAGRGRWPRGRLDAACRPARVMGSPVPPASRAAVRPGWLAERSLETTPRPAGAFRQRPCRNDLPLPQRRNDLMTVHRSARTVRSARTTTPEDPDHRALAGPDA